MKKLTIMMIVAAALIFTGCGGGSNFDSKKKPVPAPVVVEDDAPLIYNPIKPQKPVKPTPTKPDKPVEPTPPDKPDEPTPTPATDPLVLAVNVGAELVTISADANFANDFSVDWGDGTKIETGFGGDATHTYSAAGSYDIKIRGVYPHILTDLGAKLVDVKSWGAVTINSLAFSFQQASFTAISAGVPNLSNCSTIQGVFQNTPNYNDPLIASWNVSAVTNISFAFAFAPSFNQNINGWNVGNVYTFERVFIEDKAFNQPLNGWNTSNGNNFSRTLNGCNIFNQPLSNWDFSNAYTMESFLGDAWAFNQDVSMWQTGNVQDMSGIFFRCGNFNSNIGGWNTSSAVTMFTMLESANIFNQDISGWDVSSVGNFNDFMKTTGTFSPTNYDLMLNSWSAQGVQSGLTINMGGTNYTASGEAARQSLIDDYGWTILDSGKI